MGQKFILTEEERTRIRGLYTESTEEQQFDNALAQAGIVLTPEEKMEVSPECPIEEPPAEYADVVNNIKSKLDTMGVNDLIKVLKQVKSIKKPTQPSTQQPVVQEQVGATILIAGVAVPAVAVAVVAGLIAIIIIVKIGKLIFRGGTKQNPACKRRSRLVRKFGMDGNFM
jgi:hypothetical protein